MRLRPWSHVLLTPIALLLVGVATAIPATAAPAAASGGAAHPVHPGRAVSLAGVTCTAGPVLRQGATLYLAIPASCGGIDPGSTQNGCTQADAPVGIPVKIAGARHHGRLAYDSFTRMQSIGTKSSRLCEFNDLALVEINRADRGRVTAAIDGANAPTGVSAHAPAGGRKLTLGSHAVTAGASHHGGWEYDVNGTTSLSVTDVGTVALAGSKVLGMLTVLPGDMTAALPISTPASPPAEVYSLAKALQFLRKAPGFHHVTLLKRDAHL
jgi:hypothetical protein